MNRRDTLHTGGPVPSDLAGSTPAPGETVAGDATDTTTATVTSSDVDAAGNPLTASDTPTATVHYRPRQQRGADPQDARTATPSHRACRSSTP